MVICSVGSLFTNPLFLAFLGGALLLTGAGPVLIGRFKKEEKESDEELEAAPYVPVELLKLKEK